MNLSAWIILPGIGKIIFALAFIVYALKKGGSWGYLGLGALGWVVTNIVKYLVALQVNPVVYQMFYVPEALFAPGSVLFYGYAGVLTGLTEVLLIWLLLRYTPLGRVSWAKALAFGVGFGAIEALYLGLTNLASSIPALMAPQSLQPEALNSFRLLSNPLYSLAPALDRFPATLVHIFGNVLLFYGVACRQARWMWASCAYKSLVDTVAVFAMFWGVQTVSELWSMEAVLWVIGIIGWLGIQKIQERYSLAQIPAQSVLTAGLKA